MTVIDASKRRGVRHGSHNQARIIQVRFHTTYFPATIVEFTPLRMYSIKGRTIKSPAASVR